MFPNIANHGCKYFFMCNFEINIKAEGALSPRAGFFYGIDISQYNAALGYAVYIFGGSYYN
jgi:hypothetical protein